MMMRPNFLPLLLLLLSSLRSSVCVCVPRDANPIPYLYRTSEAPEPLATKSSPSPSLAPTPTPTPRSWVRPTGFSPLNSLVQTVSKTISSVVAITSPGTTNPLKPICAYTDYPDVCLSSIQSAASSLATATDARSVASLQMKALVDRAHLAIDYGRGLIADPAFRSMAACLEDCVDGYDDGLDNAEAAKVALLAGDRGTARSMLSAMFGSFRCSDAFAEGEALGKCKGPSPMQAHDDVLTKLVSNSLSISRHLGRH